MRSDRNHWCCAKIPAVEHIATRGSEQQQHQERGDVYAATRVATTLGLAAAKFLILAPLFRINDILVISCHENLSFLVVSGLSKLSPSGWPRFFLLLDYCKRRMLISYALSLAMLFALVVWAVRAG